MWMIAAEYRKASLCAASAIRHDYEAARHSIDALIHRLMEEYRYYESLQEQIAEIDRYGAEDVFQPAAIRDNNVSRSRYGYDF